MKSEAIEIDPAWLPADADMPRGEVIRIRFSREERNALRKKAYIAPSEWVEKYRVVPADSSVPGKWRNSTTPWVAGILDASFFPSVEEIDICAPPQTAKSETVNNCIGYAIDRKKGNVLVIYPDELTAKENSTDRIQPMIMDSPRLRSYTTGVADDMAVYRIKLKHIKIFLGWASSAARLGNKPLPYVVLDEIDKYPETANKREAGPEDLAAKRTRTFSHMRKIWRISTPTIEVGPIWTAVTRRVEVCFRFWVKCPECGHRHVMLFEHIRWPEGSAADPRMVRGKGLAYYICPGCQKHWDDAARDRAVREGKWLAAKWNLEKNDWDDLNISIHTFLKSQRPKRIGFHYQSWISPFVSMSEAAAAFLEGLKDKNKLKDFQNGHAAMPWVVYAVERKSDGILELRDDRPSGRVPGGGVVSVLTAGIDTQDNGFWYEIRAWGFGMEMESWQIRAGFVTSFEALSTILWKDEYKDVDGKIYVISMALQDAMGHRTKEVYDFCIKNRGKIYPTKGEKVMAQPFAPSPQEFYPGGKKKIKGGLQLFRINTKHFKDALATNLEIAPADPGAWHMNSETTEEWAFQMIAETLDENGFWTNPKNRPNHAWDCSVLNLCAAEMVGVKFKRNRPKKEIKEEKQITPTEEFLKNRRKKGQKKGFVNGWRK